MPGLYGLISLKDNQVKNIYKNFYRSESSNKVNEEHMVEKFLYGRSVISKFLDDRVMTEDSDFVLGFEGVCYSIEKNRLKDNLIQDFKENGLDSIRDLKGHYSGFIYNKGTKELIVFTDPLSTKPIYYYFNKENGLFFFASELKVVSKYLRKTGINITPDEDGFRSLLTFGYMIGNTTPIREIKKMDPGSILKLTEKTFELKNIRYQRFEKKETSLSKELVIEGIEYYLQQAISKEWEKDLEYNYNHFSFLSGGLDSRVNVLLGSKFTKNEINTLTFSVQNTPDQSIAEKIAKENGFIHTFFDLEDGSYLLSNTYDYVKANDGVVIYFGAAHQQYALSKYDLDDKGLAHSGQIGDMVFGSFTSKNNSVETAIKKLAYNNSADIIEKINMLGELKKKVQENSELVSLEYRMVNGIMNGDRACSHLVDMASPFYDKDLIGFCLNIPNEFKLKQGIYLDWMNKLHPNLSSYKWASTLTYPTNRIKDRVIGFSMKVKDYALKRIGLDLQNMNPFQHWYNTNEDFKKKLYSSEDLELLDSFDVVLKRDIESCLNHQDLKVKMAGLTAILSYKLHFLD